MFHVQIYWRRRESSVEEARKGWNETETNKNNVSHFSIDSNNSIHLLSPDV